MGIAPEKLPGEITRTQSEHVVIGGDGRRPAWTNIESWHGKSKDWAMATAVRFKRISIASATGNWQPNASSRIYPCSCARRFYIQQNRKKRHERGTHGGISRLEGPLVDDLGGGDRRAAGLAEALTRCGGGKR